MATLESIQMKIKRLQAQAEGLAAKQASTTLDRIRDLMDKHGLTIADIEGHFKGQKHRMKPAWNKRGNGKAKPAAIPQGKLPPKYRDPKTGATWSGWARPPQWIAHVKDRSKFLIDAAAEAVGAGAASKTKRAGKATVKGKQPAKYLNPETGATWSGRGPAPAWLAAAKDRSKFLIAKAPNGRVASPSTAGKPNAAVKKTLAKKSTAVRKVAAKKAAKKTVGVKKAPTKKIGRATGKKTAVKKVAATARVPGVLESATTAQTSA